MLKNMIGTVHHPSLVIADIDTLESLPDRTFRSGLGECIKHAMIGADWSDPGLMDWTTSHIPRFLSRDPESLCELIGRSISLKAAVVAADERELADDPGGGRMALNLGHTFAHAIETLPNLSWQGHSSLQHGEAVALGLIAACRCAEQVGLVPCSVGDEVEDAVRQCGLPTTVTGLPDHAQLLERMTHDKKARSGVVRLILPVSRSRVGIFNDPPADAVRAAFDALRD
jgi:3-dehydroquinate synthetase